MTDSERVYAYFGNTGLFAYSMEGKPLWAKKWKAVGTRAGWGTAASPVLHRDRLYIVNDNETASYVVALDTKTGEEIWRLDREEKSNWSTPFVWENERRTEIVTAGTGRHRSYDLSGKLLWELKGASSITIPTPFAAHGLLFISSGFIMSGARPIFAIRPGGTRDISLKGGDTDSDIIAWSHLQEAPYNPSMLAYRDRLYILLDRGGFSCFEAATGDTIYRGKKLGGGAYTSSPWAYNGKVFCLSENGETRVAQAGDDFRVLKVNRLDEMCLACPAIAHGSLIIRTASHLYRFQNQGGE